MLRPREDQVAALTRGVQLPLDPLADAHLSVILETISRAWQELTSEGIQTLTEGTEPEINSLLAARLNHHCTTNPMWSQIVTSVARGVETISFDGTHLETKPDISLFLTGRHPSFPIIIECKIINHPSGKTIDLYCKKGITRFVTGHYAWFRQEAVMIGYVQDQSSVPGTLTPHLSKGARKKLDPWQTSALPVKNPDIHSTADFSAHMRTFTYTAAAGGLSPGEITLSHLWLGATSGDRPPV